MKTCVSEPTVGNVGKTVGLCGQSTLIPSRPDMGHPWITAALMIDEFRSFSTKRTSEVRLWGDSHLDSFRLHSGCEISKGRGESTSRFDMSASAVRRGNSRPRFHVSRVMLTNSSLHKWPSAQPRPLSPRTRGCARP